MTEVYESSYGIFNHFANLKNPASAQRPLANVAFHRGEDFTTGTLLEDTMTVYRDYPIYDIFKISYLEFIAQPTDRVAMMVSIAKEHRKMEQRAVQAAEQNLQNSTRQSQQLQKEMRNK